MKVRRQSTPPLNEFNEDDYDEEWLMIGRFLKKMAMIASLIREEASQLRKKAYRYLLRNGKIRRHPKKRNNAPLRVIAVEYKCIMDVFTLSLWIAQVQDICVNSIKGSCPK